MADLPTTCPCGSRFSIQHCMSSKKGGFIYIRQNYLRDLTANILSEVCKDIEIKPELTTLMGKELGRRTANTTNDTRLDIRLRKIWQRGQQTFLDLRVFDPNASQYLNKLFQQCHTMNEKKERAYKERVLQIEHGTFTPMVFSIYGSMGRKYHTFYSRLSDLLSEKCHPPNQ